MNVFFDSEFTGLHQNTTLISFACKSETGEEFYAEFTDYDRSQVDEWIDKNVIAKLKKPKEFRYNGSVKLTGERKQIAAELKAWLFSLSDKHGQEKIFMWGDCLAYDWVLFCELYGGALTAPSNVYYLPFDIATLFNAKGVDPDISREEFSGLKSNDKHNCLWDAKVIKACHERLLQV